MGVRVLSAKRLNKAAFETSNDIIGIKGRELLSSLEESITTLKEIWKGEGSSDHINNLIKVYNSLSEGFNNVSECNVKIGKLAKDVNYLCTFNGGTPEILDEVKEVNFEELESAPDNTHTGLELDLLRALIVIKNLQEVKSKFKEITNDFYNKRTIIFNEWQESSDREHAGEVYSNVYDDLDAVSDDIDEVLDSLETAMNNYYKLEQ